MSDLRQKELEIMAITEEIQAKIFPVIKECIEEFGRTNTQMAMHWICLKLYDKEIEDWHQAQQRNAEIFVQEEIQKALNYGIEI